MDGSGPLTCVPPAGDPAVGLRPKVATSSGPSVGHFRIAAPVPAPVAMFRQEQGAAIAAVHAAGDRGGYRGSAVRRSGNAKRVVRAGCKVALGYSLAESLLGLLADRGPFIQTRRPDPSTGDGVVVPIGHIRLTSSAPARTPSCQHRYTRETFVIGCLHEPFWAVGTREAALHRRIGSAKAPGSP